MSSTTTNGAAPRQNTTRFKAPLRAVAGLILLGLAALIVLVSAPAPRVPAGLAEPEQPRVLEDWRGNSAGLERRR